MRHAVRPVAPLGAASASLLAAPAISEKHRFLPPRLYYLDCFNGSSIPNGRADDMTEGYMNSDVLMKDFEVDNLEHVDCDVYMIDREDDEGRLNRNLSAMGTAAVWSMLKSREETGDGCWSKSLYLKLS